MAAPMETTANEIVVWMVVDGETMGLEGLALDLVQEVLRPDQVVTSDLINQANAAVHSATARAAFRAKWGKA